MFFNKKDDSDSISDSFNSEISEAPLLEQAMPYSLYETQEHSSHTDLKRMAFHAAIKNRQVEHLLSELEKQQAEQLKAKEENLHIRINQFEELLSLTREKISEKKDRLQKVPEISEQLKEDRKQTKSELKDLEDKFQKLVEDLGLAHKTLIEKRLQEVKEELQSLVTIYNSVFEERLSQETDLKEAVQNQRNLCQQLIAKTQADYDYATALLARDYKGGGSKLSASFLVFVGFLAVLGAGWFFAIFTNFNEMESQNWLVFSFNNLFNYFSIFVLEYGKNYAASYIIISYLIFLLIFSVIIYICQSFISKMTRDKLDSQFGLRLTTQSNSFFKLNIRSSSLLSLWLHILPWILGIGVFFTIMAVGQFSNLSTENIEILGQRLTGQFIGITIALLCSGLFFLYLIKVIEPKKDVETDINEKANRKKDYKALSIFIIGVNALLILIIIAQSVDGLLQNRKALLAIICFVLLVNLSAIILSYGIRQLGLIKLVSESQNRLLSLSNYEKALSGNKPVQIWVQEEQQFQHHFLEIQNELLELIRMKNKSLNHLKKKDFSGWLNQNNDSKSEVEFKSLGTLSLTRKKDAQFYMLNFPHLAYQIEEVRNLINSKKRDLEVIDSKIRELINGNSGFHIRLNNELGQQYAYYQKLQVRMADVQMEKSNFTQKLKEQFAKDSAEIIEGYQLGMWTTNHLIPENNGSH